jgi:hypothetical protein
MQQLLRPHAASATPTVPTSREQTFLRRISGAGAGADKLPEEAPVFRPETLPPDVRLLPVSRRISKPVSVMQ